MTFLHSGFFLWPWSGGNTSGTIKTCMPVGSITIIYDSSVDISIMDHRSVYIYNGSIIPEVVSIPSSAAKTIAAITIAIVNTSVETYAGAPVTVVKSVGPTFKTPITGRP